MSKIFFTADNHFGSERHLELSKRPFGSVKEMDIAMIHRWNYTVDAKDTVYHLGDFGVAENVLQLNGKIFMVMGNYERGDKECVEKLRPYVGFIPARETIRLPIRNPKMIIDDDRDEVQVGDVPTVAVQLVHEPSNAIPAEAFVLFGHIHRLQMVKRNGLNVGVDCHNYIPLGLEDLMFWMNAIKNRYDEEVFLPEVGLQWSKK